MAGSEPTEQPAVRTTIVGGRPPGCGKEVGEVPRGIEVLLKKASVDGGFKKLLLKQRAEAAESIQLELSPAESALLEAVPKKQLAAMIRQTKVGPDLQPAFRGAVAAVMLAALSATGSTYGEEKEERPPVPVRKEASDKAKSTRNQGKKPANRKGTQGEAARETQLRSRYVAKIRPPRAICIAGMPPPGWDKPDVEMVEFPPKSTTELDKLKGNELQERIDRDLPKLGSEEFEVREQATLRIMQLGPRILPLIKKIKVEDLEATSRLRRVRSVLERAQKAKGKLRERNGREEWVVRE